ncbi:hypothetical protein Tsubulata_004768 [Turnera subulata]|uniref:DUF3615 domain-containing protein n=1 Tax=Turnera subulata TaxID=218843 RepID=A0A9Q0J4P9_9ROSI|nr:hypothetical protein Tsubulata_004768 [Turnera subulata]
MNRKKAIENLRNHRGIIRDPSRLLKPDDPELKDLEGIRVDDCGHVYKITPNLIRRRILDDEEAAEMDRRRFIECRPYAMNALELYRRQTGTSFDLDEVLGVRFQVCFGGGLHHLKFTAKPVESEAGTSTTFIAEVHSRAREPPHCSRCLTMDSILGSGGDPVFKIVKDEDYGDWVDLPFGCTRCEKPKKSAKQRKVLSPGHNKSTQFRPNTRSFARLSLYKG